MNFFSKSTTFLVALFFLLKTILNYYFLDLERLLKSEIKQNVKKNTLQEIIIVCNYQIKVTNFLGINSCLIKSVALKNMINYFGWEAVLCIGVERDEKIHSHSWVQTPFRDFYKPTTPMKIIRTVR